MCGIVGFAGKERAVPYLIDCLGRLEYRGYDSAGIALSGENKIEVTKRKGSLSVLTGVLMSRRQSDSHCGIGHTRWATHGEPSEKNAHPHLSEKGLFAVVHNGIIENYETLKGELISQGFSFSSDTDTEVIAQLLEKNYEGDFLSAVKKTLSRLEGSYAVAVLCRDCPGKIFCCRWGSPIVLAHTEKGSFISSDITSLLKYTDEIYKLDGGECALVDCDGIEFFDPEMKKITKRAEKISWNAEDAEKRGYRHFMLKEIYEQSETVEKTLGEYVRGGKISFPDCELSEEEMRKIKRLVFIGCGSAYHVCLTGKYVAERLTGLYASAEIASEWRYGSSPVGEDCICVVISQSGETADTLAALRKARSAGARVISIVNVVGSSVASESDGVLYTRAGPEIAVATTKAYTAQLFCVYLLALKIAELTGKITDGEVRQLVSELFCIRNQLPSLLKALDEKCKSLADELYSCPHLYFIGRNTDCAAAMEGALKLKEISYIPCEAYAAGELKHGTISLIERGTVVVALMGNGEVFSKTFSNVREVKSRGARVIALADKKSLEENAAFFDEGITLPSCNGMFSAVYQGAALQLLAYYIADNRGCDIDKPRNLAKSVTVE